MHRPIFIVCVLLALGWLGIEPSKAQDTVTPTNEGQNAPISVAMSFKRYDYMLFEPVIVEVEIRNTSAQDIILSSDNAEIPWISFIITDPRGKTVKRDRGAVFEAKLLKSQGQPLRFTIDITPYYQIRNPGEYRLRTVIGLPFGDPVITNPQRFQIREGKTLYSTSRNYQSSNLTYSIMKFSPDLSNSYAYARVEDPNANRVYANTSLGEITDTNPQILFDDSGNIHVLHIIGSGEYRYSRLDAMGGLQNQSKYISANGVPPKLMRMQDGGVLVAGGEQDKEKERKRLSSSVA
ncbi:MAG TPA: hypothetical protein VK970_26295, partial [Candidatus Methylacidiphilales bacterium]|nr:hypothetical protein [Candidatus Methylacidiphilales bacterium]